MSVSISCAGCSAPVAPSDVVCRACGHRLTDDERTALEARFEASNADYRDAKTIVSRALTISLVAGLLTVTFASIRLVLQLTSDADLAVSSSIATALVDLLVGAALVACFFGGRRTPVVPLGVAAAIWLAALVLPIALAPALAMLRFASPGGVALSIAKLGVLLLLIQGIPSGLLMKRLLSGRRG